MTDEPSFVYVTYIASGAERVWAALTDADLTAAYWGHRNVSDWRPGSRWEHVRADGSRVADVVGSVAESSPPVRLVTTWAAPGRAEGEDRHARVTFEIRPYEDIVRLTVTHAELSGEDEYEGAASGWPAVLSNLKTLLETGRTLPQAPWRMPRN
ncbi:SRPBCC family protein [Streptomyces sp. L2]|uniref:SRPBCC domain-containing protein n=1 Tax=Streptomyces sp. L2 TaxID=2162665 RepID=UPI0010119CA3